MKFSPPITSEQIRDCVPGSLVIYKGCPAIVGAADKDPTPYLVVIDVDSHAAQRVDEDPKEFVTRIDTEHVLEFSFRSATAPRGLEAHLLGDLPMIRVADDSFWFNLKTGIGIKFGADRVKEWFAVINHRPPMAWRMGVASPYGGMLWLVE